MLLTVDATDCPALGAVVIRNDACPRRALQGLKGAIRGIASSLATAIVI